MDLKTARKIAGLTQSALAKQIGLSQAAVSQIELGLFWPHDETLTKIQSVLGMEIDFVLNRFDCVEEDLFPMQRYKNIKKTDKIKQRISNFILSDGSQEGVASRFKFLRQFLNQFEAVLATETPNVNKEEK